MADLKAIVAAFGESAKGKLANKGAKGAPEDQLRASLGRFRDTIRA